MWNWFGFVTILSAAALLFLSALFVRARRTHFTVGFTIYTAASGFQKLAGGIFIYMVTDPAEALPWFLFASWMWLPANAGMVHGIAAYSHPRGRPPSWVVAAIYSAFGAVGIACAVTPALNLALFNPNWFLFSALSFALLVQAVVRHRRATVTVDRAEAKFLWIYLAIGTPFTVEGLYLYIQGGIAALWEIAVSYALATLVMLYGILRHEIFTIDLYAKRATYYTAITVIVTTGFVLLESAIENLVRSGAGPIAALGAALLIAPVAQLVRRPVDRLFPDVSRNKAYLSQRKREVYRAQLEVALADGRFTVRESSVLSRARQRLGITDAEHQEFERQILRGLQLSTPTDA